MPSHEKKHMNHAVQEWIAMFQIAVNGNKKRISGRKSLIRQDFLCFSWYNENTLRITGVVIQPRVVRIDCAYFEL